MESEKVDRFFKKLDCNHFTRKSEQANRQTKPRLHKGLISDRVVPTDLDLPSWALDMS